MTPPVLDYSRTRRPRRWVAKAVAVAFSAYGLLRLGEGLHTLCWPGHHTSYDMNIVIHNAWVDVLLGAVLLVPAGCVVAGVVRDEPPPALPPGG